MAKVDKGVIGKKWNPAEAATAVAISAAHIFKNGWIHITNPSSNRVTRGLIRFSVKQALQVFERGAHVFTICRVMSARGGPPPLVCLADCPFENAQLKHPARWPSGDVSTLLSNLNPLPISLWCFTGKQFLKMGLDCKLVPVSRAQSKRVKIGIK